MKIPYSIQEAEKLCNDFQYLIGTQLAGTNATITDVVITPFDENNKYRFFLYYVLLDNNSKEALNQDYKGLLFDVVIIAKTPNEDTIHQDLYTWLGNNMILEDYPFSTGNLPTSVNL